MKRPPLIYVAGPFSSATRAGVEENIRAAELDGIEIAKLGGFPVVPHSNTSHRDYERVQPYEFWIAGTAALLLGCNALYTMHLWRSSKGASAEVELAYNSGMRVLKNLGDVHRFLREWNQ